MVSLQDKLLMGFASLFCQSENYLLIGTQDEAELSVSVKELKDCCVAWYSSPPCFEGTEMNCFIFPTSLICVSLQSLARLQSCYGTAMGEKNLVYI